MTVEYGEGERNEAKMLNVNQGHGMGICEERVKFKCYLRVRFKQGYHRSGHGGRERNAEIWSRIARVMKSESYLQGYGEWKKGRQILQRERERERILGERGGKEFTQIYCLAFLLFRISDVIINPPILAYLFIWPQRVCRLIYSFTL